MNIKKKPSLVIIDDDLDLLDLLSTVFKQHGYLVVTFDSAEKALIELETQKNTVDIIISDLKLPMMSGLDFIRRIKKRNSLLPIILMTAEGSVEIAVEAVEAGAYDFVLKPLHMPQLLISVQRALYLNQIQIENTNLKSLFQDQNHLGLKGIIGKSAGFKKAMDLAKRVSSSRTNILITGDSGTGKEILAKAIHELGDKKNGPFVAINCSAIPESLLESELFGFVKGAFTGAMNQKIGLFEEANKGTLFLDEIGDLALPLQAKLLRVLQERKIKRIGENQFREITARIICATHKNLKAEVDAGTFREDLYFRLNVIPIFMPSLRDRKEDIIPLSEFFLKKYCLINSVPMKSFSKFALQRLENLSWRGNVRELENAIERAVVLSSSNLIDEDDLPDYKEPTNVVLSSSVLDNDLAFTVKNVISIDDLTQKYIEFIYRRNHFAIEQTARELGIDRKTLYRKLRGIENPPRDV
ncbi:MAG: sigma-54-dependent transcriptional regulator [Bacteriovoracaceae bacterium]